MKTEFGWPPRAKQEAAECRHAAGKPAENRRRGGKQRPERRGPAPLLPVLAVVLLAGSLVACGSGEAGSSGPAGDVFSSSVPTAEETSPAETSDGEISDRGTSDAESAAAETGETPADAAKAQPGPAENDAAASPETTDGFSAPLTGTAFGNGRSGEPYDSAETGYTYMLSEDHRLVLSYDGGATQVTTPLLFWPDEPYPDNSGEYPPRLSFSGLFLSQPVTAAAWGDPNAAAPIQLRLSRDGGLSWDGSEIPFDRYADGIYVGFTSEQDGWLLACSYMMPGIHASESHALFKTADGGQSWQRMESNLDEVFAHKVEGAGFVSPELGLVSYRTDDGPCIGVTADGGTTWSLAVLKIPQEYDGMYIQPLSAVVKNGVPVVPAELSPEDSDEIQTAYFVEDGGENWVLQKTP